MLDETPTEEKSNLMGRRILVVDDEEAILGVVRLNLINEGFDVDTATDGKSAMQRFEHEHYSMAILDVMLPDFDGFELARRIRQRSDIPIMMLSARDTDLDKAVGLGIGADDYLTKPFSPVELVARVKAHLRRYDQATAPPDERPDEILKVGAVRVDLGSRTVRKHDETIELTAKEFDLLALLAGNPGRAYTKGQIYSAVWGDQWVSDYSTVQVHIRRLRSKLEDDPSEPVLIKTIWGIGYRLDSCDSRT